jgi:hypothetical protein
MDVQTYFKLELQKIAEAAVVGVRNLQRGDIVITSPGPPSERMTAGSAFQDWLFRKASPFMQGLFTHSGIYAGDGKMIEAYPKGIIERDFSKMTKGKSYLVVRPKVSAEKREQAADFAKSQLGVSYNKRMLAFASLKTMLPSKVVSVTGGSDDMPKGKSPLGYQCGGLVAGSYYAVGAPLKTVAPWRHTAPAELAAVSNVNVVGRRINRHHKILAPKGRLRKQWIENQLKYERKKGRKWKLRDALRKKEA